MDIRNFFAAKKGAAKSSSTSGANGSKKRKEEKKSNGSKKRKEEEEQQEISAPDYFASETKKSPNKKAKTHNKPSPSTAAVKKETKRRQVQESDDNDSDDDFVPEKKTSTNNKRKGRVIEDSDDDEVLVVDETPSPRKKSPRKTTPAKKVEKTPSPPKKKTKAATSPKTPKLPVLEPSLTLDTFDSDSIQVGEFLQGLTFVFTGVLPTLTRDDAEDLIKTLGGRVTKSVSGKTSFLVCGETLEDGRNYKSGKKYEAAMGKKVQICLGEQQLYGLCHLYHERAKKEKGITTTSTATTKTPSPAPAPAVKKSTPVANPYAKKAAAPVTSNPYAKKTVNPYVKPAAAASGNPYAKASKNPYSSSAAAVAPAPPPTENQENQLWVDRHKPQETHEILGNKENVNKLRNWLNSWERQFLNPKASGKTFSAPKGPWKAALLSGPPGIGKTTTATLVSQEAGRDLVEFNASDVRSKKALQNSLGDITGSQSLNFGPASKKNSAQQKKRCIIMDEVDGMGAGDRSGMAELIQMIKKSKVPIICICNDRQSQKMKSLLPYCMDLRFRRPTKSVMANRALRIAKLEGLNVERNAAEAIAESCGNDVRQVLNCLQMWAQKKSPDGECPNLTYKGLKERERSINKDEILRVSLFDAAKTIVEGRRGLAGADSKAQLDSLYKRSDAFFVDYSLTGLLVQQNYIRCMVGQRVRNNNDRELAFLERMHDAAASLSDYAVAEHEIRSGDLNWGLLPTCSMLAVKTGYHVGGEGGAFLPGFPEFTAWMGKNSSKNKKQRLLNELHHHMNFKVSGDSQGLRQNYLPVLREHLLGYFTSQNTEKAIALMDEYGLSREDVMEKLDEFKIKKDEKGFSDLDSKQKAAFTREYNKGSHKSQALVAEQGGPATGKKKKGGKRERDPANLDAIDEDGGEEESDEEDEEAVKALEKFKKRGKRKSTGTKKKGKKK